MRNLQVLLSLILLTSIGTTCLAADNPDMASENTELKQRVEKLDKEMAELRKMVMEQAGETKAQKTTDADLERIAAKIRKDSEKKAVWSNLDIELYGYLKLDAAYDTSRIENGNYAQWVEREDTQDNDDQFNMTANQSRFGVKINGPDDSVMKASGLAEVDFYGGGSENKSHLMMRHAYIKLDWPEDRFNVIAGQTSDVISPLLPSTLNYSVAWWTGNIGYRRPQIRLTKEIGLSTQKDLKLEGALARTIGRDDAIAGTESGEDAGIPSLQGRASLTLPLFGPQKTTMGISGHVGEEEYDTLTGEQEFQTWSINLDVTQPINKWLTIKSEVFKGENLSAYLGGIGQGVIIDTAEANYYKEIGSKGGWIAASLGPWDKMQFNLGAGIDDVNRRQVNTGDRIMNRCVFGNLIYSANKHTDIGFELSNWRTEYYGHGDGDSLRAQAAIIYKF